MQSLCNEVLVAGSELLYDPECSHLFQGLSSSHIPLSVFGSTGNFAEVIYSTRKLDLSIFHGILQRSV